METLEIHSKDFLVKWVHAGADSSIVWQVKPLKKSINFSIYRRASLGEVEDNEHVSMSHALNDVVEAEGSLDSTVAVADSTQEAPRLRSSSVASVNQITQSNTLRSKSRSTTFTDALSSSNLILLKNYFKLVPGELVRGHFDVEEEGMYAFIFDNSFSKTVGKKVLFSSKVGLKADGSSNGIHSRIDTTREFSKASSDGGESSNSIMRPKDGQLMMSTLLKRRRKKLQGFIKRTFVLNFKYSTLSYFKTNDSKLRGQMPIKHSIVSANFRTREIFIDSGMEVWNLKALNQNDFDAWVSAFDKVKKDSSKGPDEESEDGVLKNELPGSTIAALESIRAQLAGLSLSSSHLSRGQLEDELKNISRQLEDAIPMQPNEGEDLTPIQSNSEFFDAEDDLEQSVGVVLMDGPERKQLSDDDDEEEHEESESSEDSDLEDQSISPTAPNEALPIEEREMDMDGSLYPLPLDPVARNCEVPVCTHEPPNLLSFVRKNVGKDLSSISMPVGMNEPITILQKYAEQLEYSEMIDNALDGTYPKDSGELILRIAAFAVSNLSSFRKKVRSSRKPFNPLLGETYELVREDKGFRLISEKVSHKPPVFAVFAESKQWSLSFSAAPTQKFWGKTFEISTKGTVKLLIKSTGEVFTWTQPTSLLKNIIAGEKYTEPSSAIVVKSSTGQRAVVEFSKGGMFSGRSEDLVIKAYNSEKKELPYTVFGKWTESMTLKTNNTEKLIWMAGKLLPQSEKKYGFTEFAGSLNKITAIEKNVLPACDSRLRPDLKAYEAGDVDSAESLKAQLEENQRARRAEMEAANKTHKPLFFQQVGDTSQADSGEWIYITGSKSYWNRRKKQDWEGVLGLW